MAKNLKRIPSLQAGFTLLELIIVFAIISSISAVGFINVRGFSERQQLNEAAKNFYAAVLLAKSRAQTQVVPLNDTACVAGAPLNGYEVRLTCADSVTCTSYQVAPICGTSSAATVLKTQFPTSFPLTSSGQFLQSDKQIVFQTLTGKVTSITGPVTFTMGKSSQKQIRIIIYPDGRVNYTAQ